MDRCPKCGGTKLSGPTYCNGKYDVALRCSEDYGHVEHLIYVCQTCTYHIHQPTLDRMYSYTARKNG